MDNVLLYFFSAVLIASAIKTVISKNPSYGALYLACTMISLSGIFFLLGAHFIAGLQLIVYAGAVIVLFVMVIMLFNDEKEVLKFSKWHWGLPVFLFGLTSGVISLMAISIPLNKNTNLDFFSAEQIALTLFTKYLFIFELLGFLLLLVAIGVVMLIRLDRNKNV